RIIPARGPLLHRAEGRDRRRLARARQRARAAERRSARGRARAAAPRGQQRHPATRVEAAVPARAEGGPRSPPRRDQVKELGLEGSFWPTERQKLLLLTAFGGDEAGAEA